MYCVHFHFKKKKPNKNKNKKPKSRLTGEIDSANEGGVFDDLSVVIHNHLEVRQQSMHCKYFYWINRSNFFYRARNHIIIRNWGPAIHRLCSRAAHHQIQDLHWILIVIVCLHVDILHSSTLSYAKLSSSFRWVSGCLNNIFFDRFWTWTPSPT